jgi:hypothetical protein
MEEGRWMMEEGRWMMDDGRWKRDEVTQISQITQIN